MLNVTASAETLLKQAGWASKEWLRQAVEYIENDEVLKRFPADAKAKIIGDFMRAASVDQQTAIFLYTQNELVEALNNLRHCFPDSMQETIVKDGIEYLADTISDTFRKGDEGND